MTARLFSAVVRRPARFAFLLLLLSWLECAAANAAPSVEKVEPPNWWANHSINPVRLLIRGRDLHGPA